MVLFQLFIIPSLRIHWSRLSLKNFFSLFKGTMTPVANNMNNIRLLTPESEHEEKEKIIYILTILPKGVQTKH
jgi:hypothetical protein